MGTNTEINFFSVNTSSFEKLFTIEDRVSSNDKGVSDFGNNW